MKCESCGFDAVGGLCSNCGQTVEPRPAVAKPTAPAVSANGTAEVRTLIEKAQEPVKRNPSEVPPAPGPGSVADVPLKPTHAPGAPRKKPAVVP
jgi:hypothetical protein